MRIPTKALIAATFATALVLSAFIAGGSATVIEIRSRKALRLAMETAGYSWVQVQTDGLQVVLLGTAPSEAERYRAVTLAGSIVDASRIVDGTDAETAKPVAPPAFSLEMLRNDEGISLIGLVPANTNRKALLAELTALVGEGAVTDMLETADYPEPENWKAAFDFGIATLQTLPRAKVSVDPGKVQIEAITDSPEEKARVETTLARTRPAELTLEAHISAPRPVITPFTLRFLIDAQGARFDACSADTERARDRILAAARQAGASGSLGCTLGMGTPSAQWSEAVAMAIAALRQMGAGTVSFSDADIALVAAETVDPALFDKAVGELESNLPEVFSLKAELTRKAEAPSAAPEFSALLREDGQVELRGRVPSERDREALESFARAQFGASTVYGATRIDAELPQGWPVRALSALEALRLVSEGSVTVRPDLIRLTGKTGDAQASDKVARLLAERLGETARIDLKISYDKRLDPTLNLPDGPQCVSRLNAVLTGNKITFEPASATIAAEDAPQLDALAKVMAQCQDFRMEVAGHTDSQGGEESNLRLSQSRAQAVLEALRERRVLTGNLLAQGYGESRPIADNETEEGREANRRIEFVLLDAAPLAPETAQPEAAALAEPAAPAEAAAPEPATPEASAEAQTETQPAVAVEAQPDPSLDEAAADAPPMEEPVEPAALAADAAPAEATPAPAEPSTAPPPSAGATEIPPPPLGVLAPLPAEPAAEPAPVITVAPADQSPARPLPRPAGLGAPGN